MKATVSVFVILLCFCFSSSAQGVITGKLVDSVSRQSLSLATVTVFKARDTVIITYRLSDGTGTFKVPGLPLDVLCRVVVSFSGYRGFRKEFTLSKEQSSLDLGLITMVNDPTSLDE